jgi:hypothetical protein
MTTSLASSPAPCRRLQLDEEIFEVWPDALELRPVHGGELGKHLAAA